VRSSPMIRWSTSSAGGQRWPRRRLRGSISFRKIRRTRSGGRSPTGWGRWVVKLRDLLGCQVTH